MQTRDLRDRILDTLERSIGTGQGPLPDEGNTALERLDKARGLLVRLSWQLKLLEDLLPNDVPELRHMGNRAEDIKGELSGLAAGCGEEWEP